MWEEIETRKAKERQLSGLKNQTIVVDNVPPPQDKGAVRDIIAEKAESSQRYLKYRK